MEYARGNRSYTFNLCNRLGAGQRDIPIFGTTHADHNTVDIPCAPPMSDEMIKGDYEHETGYQIINCFNERGSILKKWK